MAGYKKHISFGVVCYIVVLALLSLRSLSVAQVIEWGFCAILGALFPDIDIKSKGQLVFYHFFLILLLFLVLTQQWLYVSIVSLLSIIPILSNHRGIFHNFWFIAALVGGIIGTATFFYPHYCTVLYFDAAFFMLGIISHLLLDKGFLKSIKLS